MEGTYLFIVIPMMRPVFITTLVIVMAGIVKLYDLVVAQSGGGPGTASESPQSMSTTSCSAPRTWARASPPRP